MTDLAPKHVDKPENMGDNSTPNRLKAIPLIPQRNYIYRRTGAVFSLLIVNVGNGIVGVKDASGKLLWKRITTFRRGYVPVEEPNA